MKIDNSLKPVSTGTVGSSRAKADAGQARDAASAEVKLSTASTQLAGSSSGAPVDSARIAEIKQAIAEGRFSVNADAIADSLIKSARDLLQRKA